MGQRYYRLSSLFIMSQGGGGANRTMLFSAHKRPAGALMCRKAIDDSPSPFIAGLIVRRGI